MTRGVALEMLGEDYDDILAGKEAEVTAYKNVVKDYKIALKVANEELADLRKKNANLKEICSEEPRETKKLRGVILGLKRLVKQHEDRWQYWERNL